MNCECYRTTVMAPVKIKDIVSFTSQDQKNCVENLCGTGERGRPWLCSPRDRSGVLKAELQMERATAIGYVDVGNCGSAFIQIDVGRSSWPLERSYITLLPTATLMTPADSKQEKGRTGVRMFKRGDFLPTGADELWDRVRVTCSQPFNRRAQFGLSFLRIRSPEEEEGGASEGERVGGGQRTPEQQTSRVSEWLSSPAVQRTFFGRGPGEGSPGGDHLGGAGLSRAARMLITAAQSGRRSLIPALPGSASPSSTDSPADVRSSGTPDTWTEGEASAGNPAGAPRKEAGRAVKRKPDSRRRPRASSAPCWKKPKPAACGQPLSCGSPVSTAPPGAPEDPETCCPLCGGYFGPEYLPQHASFCQGEDPVLELSSTPPCSPAHTGSPAPSLEQDLVPCPLCSFRFPVNRIQLHASSCGDPLEPEWSWVD